jgi:coatomer subunit beta'
LAEECLNKANDFSGLLLLYTASGNADGIEKLARSAGKHILYITSV